jgi:glycosyltransferase involved in cell wall biosynthesis
MAACDVILNLRYPTVGESSGTLLRSLGLGKPVLVSDIGSFREFPDDICLKVPVNEMEEDLLFEYLNLLVSRPSLARGMGERARAWVRRECRWEVAAQRYLEFCQSVAAQAETHARR